MIRPLLYAPIQLVRSLASVLDRLILSPRYLLRKELPRKYRKWKSRYNAGAPQSIGIPLDPSLLKAALESPACISLRKERWRA